MDRLKKGLRTLLEFLYMLPDHLLTLGSILLLITIIVVAATTPSIRDQIIGLTGTSPEPQKNRPYTETTDSMSDALTSQETDSQHLSGTWRVFYDDTKTTALFDLSFTPNGKAISLMKPDNGSRWQVSTWEYTEKGDSVEVIVTLRIVDNKTGVDFPQKAWLHLTKNGMEMHGSYESQVIGYESDGTLRDNGVQRISDNVLALPLSQIKR